MFFLSSIFYRLGKVSCLLVKEERDGGSIDLSLTADYDDSSSGTTEVALRFNRARYAKLPELMPVFFLSELEIEDIRSDHIEGVNYRARDYGESDFEVLARDIAISLVR